MAGCFPEHKDPISFYFPGLMSGQWVERSSCSQPVVHNGPNPLFFTGLGRGESEVSVRAGGDPELEGTQGGHWALADHFSL